MSLSPATISSPKGARRAKKRLGRGNASGHGTYSTRGIKGQRARQGGRKGLPQFGAKHFVTRLPKVRGFQSFRVRPQVVDISSLAQLKNITEVTPVSLRNHALIERADSLVKLIGSQTVNVAYKVSVHAVSAGARASIERAGGSIILLPKPVAERRAKARRKPKVVK